VVDNGRPLIDGTLAGSTATMDRVFRFLVQSLKMSMPDAARLCCRDGASGHRLRAQGRIATGALMISSSSIPASRSSKPTWGRTRVF
jgi:N-acetylglucosamine-6-phosphate deacetylase